MERPTPLRTLLAISAFALASACAPADDEPGMEAGETAPPPQEGVVEIVARGLTFEAPDTVRPGWTTFRLVNESPMAHFALVQKVPPGIGIADQQAEVAPIFQEGMDLMAEGQTDAAMAAFGQLPEWYGEVVLFGGPGLTAAGETSEATIPLEPGTYLIECYVKTGGVFHSYNPDPEAFGMVVELVVAGEPTEIAPPETGLELRISSEEGFRMQGEPGTGRNTFRVVFEDQTVYPNFVGHDVHLVRLGSQADVQAVGDWMNWAVAGGLNTPSPAPFLGGLNDMPAGSTGYFTVDLEPGAYGLVAEVPGPMDRNMFLAFTVPEPM